MARIVLIGPPGSGKGTQAESLTEEFGWPQISTGNILRHAIESGTSLGMEAKSFMDRGELVPDGVVDGIVKERISREDCAEGFILDGFPRDLEQAQALEGIAPIDAVFDIRVPDEELMARLGARRVCDCGETYHLVNKPPRREGTCDRCGKPIYQRKDDQEDTVRARLRVYHMQTEPLIRYYREKGVLMDIDGTGSIRDTYEQIKAGLK